MPKYTLKKTTRTIKLLLASVIGVAFFSAPFLTHATSEPKNIQTPVTNTLLSQRADSSGDTSTTQSDFQEKNSILSLKTGRNLLKAADMAFHLLLLSELTPKIHKEQYVIGLGSLVTIATLAESIVKSYEIPREQNNSMRSRTFILCKLIGIMGHMLLAKDSFESSSKFGLTGAFANLIFLAHSLYGDYESYMSAKKDSDNTYKAPSIDVTACTIKNTQATS